MKNVTLRASAGALSLVITATAAGLAHGGAFQLNERSARAQGASFAGSASAAGDVTFITFNPAALSRVEGLEAGGNISLVAPISDGRVTTGPFAGQEVDADRLGVVPSGAIGYEVFDGFHLGFSNYTPFGLRTAYPADWVGQADARTSELRTVSFSPSASWQVFETLAIGGAINILYADARLTSAAVNLDGSNTGLGFSAGILWDPIPSTTVGVSYHHGYDLEIATESFNGFPGTAEASLPGWVQAGITHRVNEDIRVMVEGRWIDWSAFDSIDISTPALTGTPFAEVSDEQNYEDAIFIAAGAEYDVNETFTVRGGMAYDETPTTDEFRTPRVPDSDRLWFSAGLTYNMNDHMSLDVAYSYLLALEDPEVTLRNGPAAGTVVEYDGGAHIFSVGGSIRF